MWKWWHKIDESGKHVNGTLTLRHNGPPKSGVEWVEFSKWLCL